MTGPVERVISNKAADKVSEANQKPPDAAQSMQEVVAQVPPQQQMSIIADARGANRPVPKEIAGKQDAQVVNPARDVPATTGAPVTVNYESTKVLTYDKAPVGTTVGNDTKGTITKTVSVEAQSIPAAVGITDNAPAQVPVVADRGFDKPQDQPVDSDSHAALSTWDRFVQNIAKRVGPEVASFFVGLRSNQTGEDELDPRKEA